MRTTVLIGVCVGLLYSTSTGAAQPSEARSLFEQALEAQESGDVALAIDLYQRSLALSPRPASARNLAAAFSQRGDLLSAEEMYLSLLAGTYGELAAENRRELELALGEVRAGIAVISIMVDGSPNFSVVMDGYSVELDEASSLRVDPGEHLLRVTAPGFDPVDQTLSVARGSRESYPIALHRSAASSDTTHRNPAPHRDDPGALANALAEERLNDTPPRSRRAVWLGTTLGVVAATGLGVGLWLALRPGSISDPFWGNVSAGD